MRSAAIISTLFHALVAVLVFVGVPFLAEDELSHDRVIIVELVSIADARNLPNRMADPELEPKSEPPPRVAEQSQPEPEPQQALRSDPAIEPPPAVANDQIAPPPPPIDAQTPVQIAAPAPPPLPRAEPENEVPPPPAVERPAEKPTPPEPVEVAAFEPEPPPKKETPEPVERPEEKPAPPQPADPFASVLKSIEELEKKRRTENEAARPEPESEPKTETSTFDPVEQVLAEANTSFRADRPLSMSEIDNIRYQIQKNWNVPAGARGAENMIVALRIKLTRDGRVISVSVVDAGRMRNDMFFRTMAESAMRAVNVTRQIRDLSPEKYHLWRDMQINFDPTDMFG